MSDPDLIAAYKDLGLPYTPSRTPDPPGTDEYVARESTRIETDREFAKVARDQDCDLRADEEYGR